MLLTVDEGRKRKSYFSLYYLFRTTEQERGYRGNKLEFGTTERNFTTNFLNTEDIDLGVCRLLNAWCQVDGTGVIRSQSTVNCREVSFAQSKFANHISSCKGF
jgi:hypothetical protein